MQLVIAEKPSVARDLARVLGLRASGKNGLEGKDRVITWCIGHLVELDEPASYDPRWKPWRLDTLPMIPAVFKLRGVARTGDQLRAVRDLLRDNRFSEVVNACDAGREGELIFRYVYELAGSRLPIRRLWISSLTDEAIRQGFGTLKPGAQYDALADAARCRSEADWLVGLNATRAVTVRRRSGSESTLYSVGRVQTPTLAIVVHREQAIRSFRPRDYWEIRGTFETDGARFTATWTAAKDKVTRFGALDLATTVIDRDRAQAAPDAANGPVVSRLVQKKTREPAPLLFDLTSLQRTANRRYGMSATRTLDAAQALYERHKILTYPRTDSRHLSADMAAELPKLFRGMAQIPEYAGFAQPLIAQPPKPSKRVFDDGKVQDHHAIIPTGKVVPAGALDKEEQRIFDLVVRRFLGVFYPDAEFASTEVVIRVGAGNADLPKETPAPPAPGTEGQADETMLDAVPPPPDLYVARGRVRLAAGWQAVAGIGDAGAGHDGKPDTDEDAAPTLPVLKEGQRLKGTFDPVAKQTKPPPRHTEATLLGAMEYAGRTIEDEGLRAAMKDSGLGTPATRAATIETLIKRGFITRNGKQLAATEMGIGLIIALPVSSLASPELTGTWEARLARIARGQDTRPAFMKDIAGYVRDMVAAIRTAPTAAKGSTARPVPASAPTASAKPPAKRSSQPAAKSAQPDPDLSCPLCKQGALVTGNRGWGCSRWREGCAFVVWFELGGKRLSDAQLRELVSKGKTRKAKWTAGSGRLVLDLTASRNDGAARFEPA